MFRLEAGNILLSMYVFNPDNTPALIIQDNELRFATDAWDIEFVGRRMIIRKELSVFLMDVLFEVPSRIVIDRGVFVFNGAQIEVSPNRIYVRNNGNIFSNSGYEGSGAGLILGEEEPAGLFGAWHVSYLPRYPILNPVKADSANANPLLDSELRFLLPRRDWVVRQGEYHVNEDVRLDGFDWRNCVFDNCCLFVGASKDGFGLSDCRVIGNTKWLFDGAAERTMKRIAHILSLGTPSQHAEVESLFQAIRKGVNLRPNLSVLGPDQILASEALYTCSMLVGLYHGFGLEGGSFVERILQGLRNRRDA
jgi:hypothetical protein